MRPLVPRAASTVGTPFSLATGGAVTRVAGSTAKSPFLWRAGSTPPTAGEGGTGLVSEEGFDLFVETDCDGTTCVAGGGDEPHLMIYSEFCSNGGPWWDAVAGGCRQ